MKKWGIALGALALLGGVAAFVIGVWVSRDAEPRLREELERWLSARLNSDVQLESLEVQLRPSLRVEGTNLVLRLKGRPDLPPFISIKRISGSGGFTKMRAKRLTEVRLEGVEVVVPPGRKADLEALRQAGRQAAATAAAEPSATGTDAGIPTIPEPPLVIERLVASSARLVVMARDADHDSQEWDIRDLVIEPFSLDAAAPFHATVDTPLPQDRAQVTGTVDPFRGATSTSCRSWPNTPLPATPGRCRASTGGSKPRGPSSARSSAWPRTARSRRPRLACAARAAAACR